MTISDTIRQAIREHELSQAAIAGRAGISASQVYRFLLGQDLKLSTLDVLAEVLGLEVTIRKPARRRRQVER
jgi:transcriptional regulator with XRE-family HTH domain